MIMPNNKTLLIFGLIIIALGGLYVGNENIPVAVVGGLTGYLSKDIYDYAKDHQTQKNTLPTDDGILNDEYTTEGNNDN